MTLHRAVPLAYEFPRYLGGPSCPRCGESLITAESSEYLSEGRVRHFWACDGCGQEFHTAVELAADPALLDLPQPA